MNDTASSNAEKSYCPACNSANHTPNIGLLSFPVCQKCRHMYWAVINQKPRLSDRIVVNRCPFCGDDKDPALASGRYRCRKCSRSFANVTNQRVYRYINPLSLIYLAPIYLVAVPYLLVQIVARFEAHRYYDTIPAFTLLLVWLIFRRAYREA
jgi:transposase-like protein